MAETVPNITGGHFSTSLAELDGGKFNYLMDDDISLEMSVDHTGYIGKQIKESERSYADSYQSKLTGIIEWTEKMMRKDVPTGEEWDVIDACKRLVEKFQ